MAYLYHMYFDILDVVHVILIKCETYGSFSIELGLGLGCGDLISISRASEGDVDVWGLRDRISLCQCSLVLLRSILVRWEKCF